MLKIKKGVDLKVELLKFGFTYRGHYDNHGHLFSKDSNKDAVNNFMVINTDRKIETFGTLLNIFPNLEHYYSESQFQIKDELLETLFDLIQAGLVEKVED